MRPTGRGAEVAARLLADVEPESVEWLWEQRIPMGKLSLLVGDPGAGKSYLTLAIAAAVTRGAALPGSPRPQRRSRVLLHNPEDGAGDTIRPRADLCGVDTARVVLVDSFQTEGRRASFTPDHVPALERLLDEHRDVRLLTVDPVASVIGATTDTYRDNEVRAALDPLVDLAARRQIAVLGVLHMNKTGAMKAIYRVSGSVGFVGLARSVLLVAKEDDSGRRAVVSIKHNLCAESPAVEFELTGEGFRWVGEVDDLDADRLLAPPPFPEERSARAEAVEFLRTMLSSGPQRSADVLDAADNNGVDRTTLKRARKQSGVISEQLPTGRASRGEWWMRLPSDPHLAPSA